MPLARPAFYKIASNALKMKSVTFCLVIGITLNTVGTMAQSVEKISYLALGDSYTIGESVSENERWPVQLVKVLRENGIVSEEPRIIATTGWRTDDLRRAIEAAKLQPGHDLVSLLIGVNNQYQGKSAEEYATEFRELLMIAIHLAGGQKSNVFVVSIPDYGFTPFGLEKKEKISKDIDLFNSINKRIADELGIRYFDITPVSRRGLEDPALVASDGLHPSGKMYREWVELMVEEVTEMVGR